MADEILPIAIASPSPAATRVAPDRFGVLILLLVSVLGAFTWVVFFYPGIPFALVAPEADTVVDTAATIAAGCVAAFAWLRYRDSGREDALLQSSAFLTLFVAGVARVALQISDQTFYTGFALETPGQAPIYGWTFARMVAGVLLLGGAVATLNRRSVPRQRWLPLLVVGPVLTLLFTLVVLVLEPSLPVLLQPETLQRLVDAEATYAWSMVSPALVVAELLNALLFAVAALAYVRLRSRSEPDGYTVLLSTSMILAAVAQVHFAFAPGAHNALVTSGDLLRLAFYLAALAAVGSAIRDDFRQLRRANADLERLRGVDAERITADERARLAREVHDGLVQDLWLARLTSGRLRAVARLPRDAHDLLRRLDAALESAQAEARQALITLRAHSDVPFGDMLQNFVNDYADRFDMDIETDIDASASPPTEVQGELLRVCREALNNVRKHADATKVRVLLLQDTSTLRLVTTDNGRGFDSAAIDGQGFGMMSMLQRAENLGGRLSIDSEPMGGTTVKLELPLGVAPGHGTLD